MGHRLLFPGFIAHLCNHTRQAAAIFQTVLLADHKMHALSGRAGRFPDRVVFDAVQFELQIVHLILQFSDPVCQINGFIMFFLVSVLIVLFFFHDFIISSL